MGKVIRVVLHFRERFWERIRPQGEKDRYLAQMSFSFSQDAYFPTWWTSMPEKSPIITGWAPLPASTDSTRMTFRLEGGLCNALPGC